MPQRSPKIEFLGHSTVLVELDGVRLLTDPVLRDRIGPLRRGADRPDAAHHDRIDAVLVSHLHWDHFDPASLERLGPDVRIVVPPGAGAHVRERGFTAVEELAVNDETRVGPVVVRATPAEHAGFRPPLGPRAEAVGYVIGGSSRVYFAGDTDLFAAMAGIEERLDVALLPVWGWGPTLGPGHLDPDRAARALTLLRPRAAVPIHWGTFWPIGLGRVAPSRRRLPPIAFARAAALVAPSVAIHVTPPARSVALAF